MKSAYIETTGPVENLKYAELPTPTPKEGEVLVQLKYASMNHLDLWIRKGIPGHRLSFPHILGADGSGIVKETGQEVILYPAISCMNCSHCLNGLEQRCKGYKVLGEDCPGTNAEFISVPKTCLFPKPPELTFQEAAAFPLVTLTAWEMLVNKAAVQAGDTVLVHGAGSGVSQMGIQIAAAFNATVITTSTSDEKLKIARELGAHYAINSKTQDFYKAIKAITPQGVDVIFDHIGGPSWEKNIRLLRTGGTLVTCGATAGHEALTDLRHVFFRQLKILGSTMGNKRDFSKLVDWMKIRKIRAVIGKEFSLSEIQKAHHHLEKGEQTGKVLLKI